MQSRDSLLYVMSSGHSPVTRLALVGLGAPQKIGIIAYGAYATLSQSECPQGPEPPHGIGAGNGADWSEQRPGWTFQSEVVYTVYHS